MNTQNYVVNIRVGLANPARVNISQGDTGRTLAFSLYDGLSPFTPPTGSTVTIVGRKPSKLGFSEACTVSGNVATVTTTLAMTQEAGKFPVELRIEANGESIGTANFTMYIEPSPHPDGTTDGTHATVDNLQTQIGNLANLATTAKTNLVSAINEAAQSGGVVIDDTLTQTGQAADAKKTGDEIGTIKADLGDKIDLPSNGYGVSGKVLRSTGSGTEWASVGQPTDAQAAEAVDDWLTQHPEATTTVLDGSLAESKFSNALKLKTIKDHVTPEMYGAKGDGITDDTEAIREALNSRFPVYFGRRVYCVSESIIGTANVIIGDQATIKLIADFSSYNVLQFADSLKCSGFVFDANGNDVNGFLMVNGQSNEHDIDVEISNISIDGVHDLNDSTLTSLINVYYCGNVSIHDVCITNCTKLSDGVAASGSGGLTGIRVQYFKGNLVAERLYIRNCYNVDRNGDIVIDDADSIFCLTIDEKSSCVVKDSVFYNGGKRAIKIQSFNPAHVQNVYAYNDIPSLVNLITMQAQTINGVDIAGDGVVDSCVLINRSNKNTGGSGVAISGNGSIINCTIDFLNSNNNKGILIGNSTVIDNCILKGFVAGSTNTSKDLNINNSKIYVDGTGQGIQYYDTSNDGVVIIRNTQFINLSNNVLSECSYFATGMSVFIDSCIINGYFSFYSKRVEVKNSKVKLDNNNISYDRIFKLYGSGSFEFSNINYIVSSTITQTSKALIFISSGNDVELTITDITDIPVYNRIVTSGGGSVITVGKGIKLERLNVSSFSTVNTIPDWASTLPSTSSLKDGMLCQLLTDGKLYKIVSGIWTVIN